MKLGLLGSGGFFGRVGWDQLRWGRRIDRG